MVTSGGRHNVGQRASAEGFAAKLAPRYDGPYQFVDFVSSVICKIRHTQSKKERTVYVGELKQQQNEQTAETSDVKQQVRSDRIRCQAEARVIHTPHGKDNQDNTRTLIRISR